MKTNFFVSFPGARKGAIIHLADCALAPLCGQTDANKSTRCQREIGPCTCQRCHKLAQVLLEACAPSDGSDTSDRSEPALTNHEPRTTDTLSKILNDYPL